MRFERTPLPFCLSQAIRQGNQHPRIKTKAQVSAANVDIFNIITIRKFHGSLPGNDSIPLVCKAQSLEPGVDAPCAAGMSPAFPRMELH